MNFEAYKKSRRDVKDIAKKIVDANDSKSKNSDYTDERIYKYTKDKAGNTFVLMRFLPSKNDLPPVISRFRHFFEHKGKWFVEFCPTKIGKECPVNSLAA